MTRSGTRACAYARERTTTDSHQSSVCAWMPEPWSEVSDLNVAANRDDARAAALANDAYLHCAAVSTESGIPVRLVIQLLTVLSSVGK